MRENLILQNPIGGGKKWVGGTGTMTALTAGHQQDEGGGNTGWSVLTEAVKMFGPAAITQEFSKKNTQIAGRCWGGVNKVRHV